MSGHIKWVFRLSNNKYFFGLFSVCSIFLKLDFDKNLLDDLSEEELIFEDEDLINEDDLDDVAWFNDEDLIGENDDDSIAEDDDGFKDEFTWLIEEDKDCFEEEVNWLNEEDRFDELFKGFFVFEIISFLYSTFVSFFSSSSFFSSFSSSSLLFFFSSSSSSKSSSSSSSSSSSVDKSLSSF